MSALVIEREVIGGMFVNTGKKKTVKNLGWLFRHGNLVTELHFKQDGLEYRLTAYLVDGRIYSTHFASREVFTTVFNRNRNMRGVVCFFNDGEYQYVGELTTK